jgi:hypothetical protein
MEESGKIRKFIFKQREERKEGIFKNENVKIGFC